MTLGFWVELLVKDLFVFKCIMEKICLMLVALSSSLSVIYLVTDI